MILDCFLTGLPATGGNVTYTSLPLLESSHRLEGMPEILEKTQQTALSSPRSLFQDDIKVTFCCDG